jgi:menaquinone-9 beta-reductase
MNTIRILGAGPAGAAAALAALDQGRAVELCEKSRFPRHKVCGEFLSPEVSGVLERLGAGREFAAANPARIHRLVLHFGTRARTCTLPETALGLSRYALDHLLLEAAKARGAVVVREFGEERPDVIATGRAGLAPKGKRLFGFKAHFRGPIADAVELFFFSGVYVGINVVEDGVTNVCGLAPEPFLRARGFDFDAILAASEPLAERVRPLARSMEWLAVGPVTFAGGFRSAAGPYRAGDALGFVDPFTGTGILNALLTGRVAGMAAARGTTSAEYEETCRRALARPVGVAALFRKALQSGWIDFVAPCLPAELLYRLTRPRAAA